MSTLYRLHAIFSSLQGEGRNMGRPCTFVRFSTCNLACPWCDTHKSVKMQLSAREILHEIHKREQRSVIVTGGEPTIQPGLVELVERLKADGLWVALETNGLLAPVRPELFDYIAVSPKQDYAMRYDDARMLRHANEVRIVATVENMVEFCLDMRARIAAENYYISPLEQNGRIHYHRALKLLAAVNARDRRALSPWSLSIQMHKVLGLR